MAARPRRGVATTVAMAMAAGACLSVVGPALAQASGAPAAQPSRPAPPASASTVAVGDPPLRPLAVPVQGVAAAQLQDTYHAARGGSRQHQALDIAAPRGRPVYAADDGTPVKLFRSVPGGLTLYQFDPERRVAYYYAHLDRYADGLREGMALRRCELIGYVGTSGNAPPDAPHLHFAVFRLGALRQWWVGSAVDPLPALRAGAAAGLGCTG